MRKLGYCLAAICGVALLTAAAVVPQLQPVCLAAVFLLLALALSRFRLVGLAIAFFVCRSLAQFLKRAIFLLGPQPQVVYWGIQLLPTLVLGMLFVAAVRRLGGKAIPSSGKLLSVFVILSLTSALQTAWLLPVTDVLSGIHETVLPLLLFFVGLALAWEEVAKLGKAMAWLSGLSVVYGIIQIVGGPTLLDRQWAAETNSYSLHAGKVFAYLEGAASQFRGFSYYADPLTWGLFLVAGFLGAAVARAAGKLSQRAWWLMILLTLTGLFFTQTRTCWVGFLVVVCVYLALRNRALWRPWLVFCSVTASLWLVVGAGQWLYREVFLAQRLPIVANPIVTRYLTVGTVEARISALESLKEAVTNAPPIGYGLFSASSRDSQGEAALRPGFSHNMLVELVWDTGVPGALLFLCFYFFWLREGFSALRRIEDDGARRAVRWMVAFSVGFLITGYLNGLNFMTYEFFVILGAVSGLAAHRRCAVEPQPAESLPTIFKVA